MTRSDSFGRTTPTEDNLYPFVSMNDQLQDHLISLRDAGARLALSQRAVYRLIARGELPRPVKVGGASRLYASDIATFLQRLKAARQ